MKVLFIGGTGNISTAVSRLALDNDIDLWLLNRSGKAVSCTKKIKNANSIQGSINDQHVAQQLASHQWDVVVNWVAFSPSDIERDIELFAGKTEQYIFISSASCYQNPHASFMINEDTPLSNPHWEYSRLKIAAEKGLMKAFRESDFPVTIVRPSHTYSTVIPITLGGWNEYTTVDRIKRGMPIIVQGDGTSLWTLTHADDFANGFIGLLGNNAAIGEAFHITSDEVLNWNQIYQMTAQAVGCNANIVHITTDKICELDPSYKGSLLGDKAVSAVFDNRKIKTICPNFSAKIPFREGIKKTIAWFEEDTKRQVIERKTNLLIEQLLDHA